MGVPPLTVAEIAAYLGVGEDVVRDRIRKGDLRAGKVGGRWRIRPSDLTEYVTRGLHLTSPFGRFRRPVTAITAQELAATYDLVIVAVRAHQYESAVALGAKAFGPNTVLLPVVEGVGPLAATSRTVKQLGAVFEGRISIDADGIVHQRKPAADLHIGALDPEDEALAQWLAGELRARGLVTAFSTRIRGKAWERFSYMTAGIAAAEFMQRPLRDAVRFASGRPWFEAMLEGCGKTGEAAGFAPNILDARRYRMAFALEAMPVDPPATIRAGGNAGDEAAFLFAEMMTFATETGVMPSELKIIWDRMTGNSEPVPGAGSTGRTEASP